MPTQGLANGVWPARRIRGGVFRGGPDWPLFHLQLKARQCRGIVPIPWDLRPIRGGDPEDRAEIGAWCGPVSPHFGHMIADFGMRIAASSRLPADVPLVFSTFPEDGPDDLGWFWQLVAHVGVARDRVRLVARPTRFATLLVAPQAERLGGKGPGRLHLDLMDEIVARQGPVPRDIGLLFVSRRRLQDARIAGERYLAGAVERAGGTAIDPETLTIAEQVAFYRGAKAIVFSEGSALHALQLLGRVPARVAVMVRRPGARIGRASLRPRVAELRYWEIARGLVHGLDARGRRQIDRALAVADGPALLRRFAEFGLPLDAAWDERDFLAERDDDLRRYLAYLDGWNLHPGTGATVRASAAELGIAL